MWFYGNFSQENIYFYYAKYIFKLIANLSVDRISIFGYTLVLVIEETQSFSLRDTDLDVAANEIITITATEITPEKETINLLARTENGLLLMSPISKLLPMKVKKCYNIIFYYTAYNLHRPTLSSKR